MINLSSASFQPLNSPKPKQDGLSEPSPFLQRWEICIKRRNKRFLSELDVRAKTQPCRVLAESISSRDLCLRTCSKLCTQTSHRPGYNPKATSLCSVKPNHLRFFPTLFWGRAGTCCVLRDVPQLFSHFFTFQRTLSENVKGKQRAPVQAQCSTEVSTEFTWRKTCWPLQVIFHHLSYKTNKRFLYT